MKLHSIINALFEYEEVINAMIERKKKIDFSQRYVEGAIRYQDSIIHYETIRKRQFKKIFRAYIKATKQLKNRCVLDYGSGKGYMLYLLSKTQKFHIVNGLEILPELCEIAKNNMRNKDIYNIDIFNADARIYNDIDIYNTFFMFNPFPKEAMIEVAKRINESLLRKKRKICIIYVNCVHEEILLDTVKELKGVNEIRNLPRIGCKSTIYTNF